MWPEWQRCQLFVGGVGRFFLQPSTGFSSEESRIAFQCKVIWHWSDQSCKRCREQLQLFQSNAYRGNALDTGRRFLTRNAQRKVTLSDFRNLVQAPFVNCIAVQQTGCRPFRETGWNSVQLSPPWHPGAVDWYLWQVGNRDIIQECIFSETGLIHRNRTYIRTISRVVCQTMVESSAFMNIRAIVVFFLLLGPGQ